MFKLDNEAALLDAFRPKDRKLVQLTPEVRLPQFVRNYLSWKHPGGTYVYLVFATPGGAPTGIVFDSNSGSGPAVPAMCDWCHLSSSGSTVGLLTARRNAKKSVGVHVCSDLGCQQRLEEEADRQGISVLPWWEKLIERMGRFASESLDIDLSGAGR
ncbi:MAG: FBP domain-containing protein [Myxococcaceae bacterium]|nr:FBP domain-containing protein [Myxococcaceae bacterium]